MSPLELRFLLHCYYSPAAWNDPSGNLLDGFIINMLGDRVIERTGDITFGLTDKGKFWIHEILDTPQPKQIYVSGRTTAKGEL
jgi:hypothetical protein